MFVSCSPDPNASLCSSSSSITEGTPMSPKKFDKGKAKVDYPSKIKNPKPKK